MSPVRVERQAPYDLSQLQIERMQDLLDANVERPSDLAEQWGISKSSASMFFARIRERMEVHTTHQMLVLAQRAGAITMTYDPGRGDANIILMRLGNEIHKPGG